MRLGDLSRARIIRRRLRLISYSLNASWAGTSDVTPVRRRSVLEEREYGDDPTMDRVQPRCPAW